MNTGLGITLPKSWNWMPLKLATTFLNRGTAPDYVDDGRIRVIGQAANQPGGLDWERTRFHDHDGDPKRLRGYLLAGDVLVNSTGTGTLGRVGYFDEGPDDLCCVADGHVTVVRADRQVVEPRYMYYWLASRQFYDHIYSSLIVGATNQIELNRDRLAAAPIALPPLDEQRHIVDLLDHEARLIDLLLLSSESQRILIWARLQELMRDATVGASNPSGPTGLPWMPFVNSAWPLTKVSREFLTSSGTTPSSDFEGYFDGPFPWINSSDLPDGEIRRIERSVTQAALDGYPALKKQRPGSLIIAMYGQGDTKGKVGLLLQPAFLNQACCALFPNGKIRAEFAAYWFRARKQEIVSFAYGAGQPNLSQELIRQLVIPAPRLEEQGRIVEFLHSKEIECNEQSSLLDRRCQLLSERREALIAAAVTGQIDVTTTRGVDTSGVAV